MIDAATALIADDEPALRVELGRLLAETWPELTIVASVGDGAAALEAMERLRPNVAFLDIRMPPPSGLDVARRAGAGTAVVFVTAYDTHAVEAFERAAVDYLLKPVLGSRLQETGHGRVKGFVRIGQPLRPGVVEVRQRALLERLRRGLVAGHRPLRVAGNRLVHPLDPFGRVQPAVTQFDQPLRFQGFRRQYTASCCY